MIRARMGIPTPCNGLLFRDTSPHISPPFYYVRRSARCVGAYSLQPARRSVSYAFAVFRSVPPSQRHPDALATNGGEMCGPGRRWLRTVMIGLDLCQ